MTERYSNKRILHRSGGKFRKATMADVGLAGVCPVCHHLLIRVYDGNQNDPHPDPRRFRSRCFTCEPETEQEKSSREAAQPTQPTLTEFFAKYIEAKGK